MCTLAVSVSEAPFSPTGGTHVVVPTANSSVSVALPTDGSSTPAATKVLVTNLSGETVFIALGDSSVAAVANSSVPVQNLATLMLSIGANTYIAAITLGNNGSTAIVVINTGF